MEAAGVEPASEEYLPEGLYMRVRFWFLMPDVRKRRKTAGHQTRMSHDQTPSRHPIASLFNGIWPPTTRRGRGRRSQLIKLRERTEYPQLRDIPSDLRVNGARHASRESLPPSKPYRPHRMEPKRSYATAARGGQTMHRLGLGTVIIATRPRARRDRPTVSRTCSRHV